MIVHGNWLWTLRCVHVQVTVELMTPEGHIYRVGRLSAAERAQKILKYRQKRHERNFTKRIKYQCRKTLADSRPRVRGRFARNDDAGAILPHESKKALAAKKGRPGKHVHVQTASDLLFSVEGEPCSYALRTALHAIALYMMLVINLVVQASTRRRRGGMCPRSLPCCRHSAPQLAVAHGLQVHIVEHR